jgi:hypothetical protein
VSPNDKSGSGVSWLRRDGRSLTIDLAEVAAAVEKREQLLPAELRPLRPADRRLVERVMANHPGLTAAEAIEHLRAFGGL